MLPKAYMEQARLALPQTHLEKSTTPN